MKQAQSQINGFGKNVNRSINGVGSTVSRTVKGIGAALASIGVGMGVGSAIKDAMETEAALQQVHRQMGESANEFTNWANKSAGAFGMARSEALKYGAVYGNLISGFSTGTEQTFQRTQDLLKTSAVVASSTGRTMEDVMERIRSGLLGNTEAIEDLGINVNIAMIESTRAFQQFANGKSWQKLDFNTQQNIRLMAIMEQAATKYGLALNQNTATSMAMFVAQLKNIRTSLGEAFLPLLNTVLPALTAFAAKVADVMGKVSMFMAALFGKTTVVKTAVAQANAINQQATATDKQAGSVKGLGKALKKTGKEAAKAAKASRGVAGFDEINQLADDKDAAGASGAGGGGAGGGTMSAAIPEIDSGNSENRMQKIAKSIKELAKRFRELLKPIAEVGKKVWHVLRTYFLEKVAGIQKFWAENSKQLGQAWKNFWGILKPILMFIVKMIWEDLKGAIDGIIRFVQGLIKVFSGVFTGDFKKVWEGLKDIFLGGVKAVWHIVSLLLVGKVLKGLKLLGIGLKTLLKKPIAALTAIWKGGLGGLQKNAKFSLNYLLFFIKGKFKDLLKAFGTIGGKLWSGLAKWFSSSSVGKFFANSFKAIGNALSGIKSSIASKADDIWKAIRGKFDAVANWFKVNVGDKITASLANAKNSTVKKADEIWEAIKGKFSTVYNWFKTNVADRITSSIANVKSAAAARANDIWNAIKDKFLAVYNWFKTNVGDKITSSIANVKNTVATRAGEIWSAIKGKFVSIYEWFKTNLGDKIPQAILNVKTTVQTRAGEIWTAIRGKFVGIYDWFKVNVGDKIPQAINNVKTAVGNKATEVWNTLKSKFTNVYSWFKTNVVDKISSAFNTIRTSFTDGLTNGVKTLLNKLIDGVNAPIKNLKNFSVMGKKPFSGLPTIPKLAKGGITNGPTLALVGDNPGGKEVVSPLNKLQDLIAGAVGNAVIAANQVNRSSGSGSGGDIVLNIDGRTFARIVNPHLEKESKRMGTNIKIKPI
ncbi:hypothetical protein [Bacillus sp. B-jedd]|uniref:hypothetical protein n=1 Tax=Bacillus sp. B-jedd TaxID=1476857 RepID=UPI0011DE1C93|nr:hypothetical protein [Bacillus sp. B-jedd]